MIGKMQVQLVVDTANPYDNICMPRPLITRTSLMLLVDARHPHLRRILQSVATSHFVE